MDRRQRGSEEPPVVSVSLLSGERRHTRLVRSGLRVGVLVLEDGPTLPWLWLSGQHREAARRRSPEPSPQETSTTCHLPSSHARGRSLELRVAEMTSNHS